MSRGTGGSWTTTDEVQFVKHLGEWTDRAYKSPREELLLKYKFAIKDRHKSAGESVDWDYVRFITEDAISQYDIAPEIHHKVELELNSHMHGDSPKPFKLPEKTRAEIGEEIRRREHKYLCSLGYKKGDF